MKKIFVLLCLVAGSASASDYLVWRDEAGVQFALTKEKPFICAGMERAYVTNAQGEVQYGCWLKAHNQVHINLIGSNGIVDELVLDAGKFQRKINTGGQPLAPKINLAQ